MSTRINITLKLTFSERLAILFGSQVRTESTVSDDHRFVTAFAFVGDTASKGTLPEIQDGSPWSDDYE